MMIADESPERKGLPLLTVPKVASHIASWSSVGLAFRRPWLHISRRVSFDPVFVVDEICYVEPFRRILDESRPMRL
jgi:hypothetical protein